MEGSVFTPILLGVLITVLLFVVMRAAFRVAMLKATHFTLISAVVVFILSLLIGSWVGMGIGFMSFGMCIASVLLYVVVLLKGRVAL